MLSTLFKLTTPWCTVKSLSLLDKILGLQAQLHVSIGCRTPNETCAAQYWPLVTLRLCWEDSLQYKSYQINSIQSIFTSLCTATACLSTKRSFHWASHAFFYRLQGIWANRFASFNPLAYIAKSRSNECGIMWNTILTFKSALYPWWCTGVIEFFPVHRCLYRLFVNPITCLLQTKHGDW